VIGYQEGLSPPQLPLNPCEQALSAAQQVPVAALSLPGRLSSLLAQAHLLTLDQVLDLTYRDTALQLQIAEPEVSLLFSSLAAYFEHAAVHGWLYPLLPPRCFAKPCDVLVLAPALSRHLQAEGHARLGTLAALPPTAPFAAEVRAALHAYVETFRRTTIHYQQRILSVQGIPGRTANPGLPLADLELPSALRGYLERLGVTALSTQVSPAEWALIWGLPPAWSEALYRAVQKAKVRALSLPPVASLARSAPELDPILPVLDAAMLEGVLAAAGYPGLSLADEAGVAALRTLLPQPLTALAYFRRYLPEWLARTQLPTLEPLLRALGAFYQDQALPMGTSPDALGPVLQRVLPPEQPPLGRQYRSFWRDFFRLGSRV